MGPLLDGQLVPFDWQTFTPLTSSPPVAFNVCTVVVPVSDGALDSTVLPVPVLVVVPVPPRATGSVPLETLPALRLVTAAPLPENVPENVPPVTVPVNVGEPDRTTDPVPVLVVVPVPPRATASVPLETLPAFNAVMPLPAPVNVVAATVPFTFSWFTAESQAKSASAPKSPALLN